MYGYSVGDVMQLPGLGEARLVWLNPDMPVPLCVVEVTKLDRRNRRVKDRVWLRVEDLLPPF